MIRMKVKKSAAAMLLVIFVLTAAACGNQESDPSASAAAAAEATVEQTEAAAAETAMEQTDSVETETAASQAETDSFTKKAVAAESAETTAAEDAGVAEQEFRDTHTIIEQAGSYSVYELPFDRNGMYIYGQMFLPDGIEGALPLVIIGHGLQATYASCVADASAFAEAGIAAYIFDFCGGSYQTLSDGDFTDMSVLTEKEDMRTVLDGLEQFAFIDRENIFLMGESQGGFVASLLAAERESDVAGMVLFYPGYVIPDFGKNWFGSMEQIPANPTEAGYAMGYRYFADTIEMDPYAEIAAYQKPVLIIHGDNDEVVPIDYSYRALEVYENADLLVIEGAGHGFMGDQFSEAISAAVGFVQDHIR